MIALAFSTTVAADDGKLCHKGIVSKISAGHVVSNNYFQVQITFSNDPNHSYPLSESADLDTKPGAALMSLLVYSKATATTIEIWDHYGNKCDDFDEIVLSP